MMDYAFSARGVIREHAPDFESKVAIILGSGLGSFAESLEKPVAIPYKMLPYFPVSRVPGHHNHLLLGYLKDTPLICLQGRAHYYEGVKHLLLKTMIRTLRLLGVETLVITNAAGSLHHHMLPSHLAVITDHINFQGKNPLIGDNDDDFGPRFFGMENAYDTDLRQKLKQSAEALSIPLHEGVYIATLGPGFETPAEIRAFRMWGADLVGMSTVPEVLIARHCGLKVVAISAITNYAAGMRDDACLSHEETLDNAERATPAMTRLLERFVMDLS